MRLATTSVFCALALAGCITPSIPIPPPDPTEMMFHLNTVDTVTTTVFAYPRDTSYCTGIAYLYDRQLHHGVIQDVNVDCSIGPTQPMTANAGDSVDVSVQVKEQTISTCVVLREGAPSPTDYCSP